MDDYALPGADVVHLLVRLALDGDASDAHAHEPGERGADELDERPQLRALADDGRVDVLDFIAGAAHLVHRRAEKLGGIGAAPLLVRVRKMRADVAERRRAEERVDHRVYENVSVGVGLQPRAVGNQHASQDKGLALLEDVRVISESNAHGDDKVKCSNYLSYNISDKGKSIEKQFVFTFVKLFEEGKFNSEFLNYINNEPIDIVIKYIDLTDKSLNRNGIKQTYKDQDNQEIKYCIRSILYNLPWIRKIYILMPNEKVNFFKSIEEINEKIIYVKDKDLLGFNSANIQAFIFNLFKMEKFGLSKNFIYMEDDYFIGKPLKKYDFFYYDNITKKILPYLVTTKFYKLNNTEVMEQYNSLFKIKDIIDPHSSPGFWLGIFITHKFFLENYKAIIISTEFSHNAIAENIDDLKEIFEEAKKYKFFNETLYSKQRYILNLNHQHFVNLYQLNIKYRKVHSIKSKYINIEKANKNKLNSPLFVINTNGNHIPLKRQLKIQKKILEKKFSIPIKYEKIDNKKALISLFSTFR